MLACHPCVVNQRLETSMSTDMVIVQPTPALSLPQLFEKLSIQDNDMRSYITDAETRYRRCSFHENTTALLMTLVADAGSLELQAKVEECREKVWSACGNGVLKFRDRIQEMALTVLDLTMKESGEADGTHMQKRLERLRNLYEQTKHQYESQNASLVSLKDEFQQGVRNGLEASRQERPWYLLTFAAGGSTCLGTVVAGLLVSKYGLAAVGLAAAGSSPPLAVVGGILTGGMTCARGHMLRHGARHHDQIAKMYDLNGRFVKQTTIMWYGVMMQVRDLNENLEALQQLEHENESVRQMRVHRIVKNLFGMSMAIDEFIVWLEVRGYFPPCLSIADYVGTEKYRMLQSVIPGAACDATK
mmetsp:Transcript_122378/g.357229  ORF Transcript_122378/g.357229 Transcript_122378/m.357229 type:complete len:359 (-) Transcript_122378:311-1387(-)